MNGFHHSYQQARERFLRLVAEAGPTTQETLTISTTVDSAQALSIDIAVFGELSSSQLLFHVSGTHGVEGFPGSAIQADLLSVVKKVPPSTALIFIHGVNPFGMAMLRRVNENNVDLNRNFLAENEKYEGAPELYTELDPILNPTKDVSLAPLQAMAENYTEDELKLAILTGQYEFPRGLFYGGASLEEGPSLILGWLQKKIVSPKRVIGIEIHTGLGEYGEQILLTMCSEFGLAKRKAFETAIGCPVILEKREMGGYPVRGGMAEAMARQFHQAETIWMVQEFGTFPPFQMLAAFREENFYCHQGAGPEHPSRKQLLESFSPRDPDWEKKVITQGRRLFEDSLAYLTASC